MKLYILFIYSTLFYGVSVTFGAKSAGGAFSWPNILLLLLVGTSVIKTFMRGRLKVRIEHILISGFIIVALLGNFIVKDFGLFITFLVAIIRGVALIWITPVFVRSTAQMQQVLNAIIGTALLGSLTAFIQEFLFLQNGTLSMGLVSLNGGYFTTVMNNKEWLRVSSFLTDPNVFAVYLLLGISIVYVRLLNPTYFRYRKYYLIMLLCLIAAILLTFSRGAIVALVLLLGYMLIFYNQGKRISFTRLSITLLIIVVFFFIFQSRGVIEERSSLPRLFLLQEAVWLTLQYPLLGVGVGNMTAHSAIGQASHNIFLEVSGGTGLIGFSLFSLLLIVSWRRSLRYPQLHSAVMVAIFASLFLSTLTNVMFWLPFALSSALVKQKQPVISDLQSHENSPS